MIVTPIKLKFQVCLPYVKLRQAYIKKAMLLYVEQNICINCYALRRSLAQDNVNLRYLDVSKEV